MISDLFIERINVLMTKPDLWDLWALASDFHEVHLCNADVICSQRRKTNLTEKGTSRCYPVKYG